MFGIILLHNVLVLQQYAILNPELFNKTDLLNKLHHLQQIIRVKWEIQLYCHCRHTSIAKLILITVNKHGASIAFRHIHYRINY